MKRGDILFWDSASPRARFLLELAGVAILFCLAVGLRLTNFQTVPPLTDEFKEVSRALDMYERGTLVLVAPASYIGPLFTYLLALFFRLFGVSMLAPRLFVLIIGALTTVLTYYFGKGLTRGDWRVGALAALLLALNAHHILFNSHVAWSNDTTPFFTTLALVAYAAATRGNRPLWLCGTGAAFGLALQTHPTALGLAPAFALDFLLRRESRRLLRTPAPYLAIFAFLVAYAPLLYFNWQNNFDSLRMASTQTYAFETAPTLEKTVANVLPQMAALGRAATSSFGDANTNVMFTDPGLIVFSALTCASTLWMARRAEPFPLIAFLCGVVFFAVFNRYNAIPDSARYFQWLLPILFVAWSQAALWLWEGASARGRMWKWLASSALFIFFVGFMIVSQRGLYDYYAEAMQSGRNNSALLDMIARSREPAGMPLVLEWELAKLRMGRGGNVADNLVYLARLNGQNGNLVSTGTPADIGGLRNYLEQHETAYFIGFTDAPELLGEEYPLQPRLTTRFPCPTCTVSQEFTLYWWERP